MISAVTPTTNNPTMVSVAMRRFIPSRSSRVARGSSRYASSIPATKGSRTSRNRTTAATTAANTAIQNATGRVRFMVQAYIKPTAGHTRTQDIAAVGNFRPVWQGDHTLAQKYYFVSDLHMGGDGQLQHCDYAAEFIEFLNVFFNDTATTE